jgi:shikimate kinase
VRPGIDRDAPIFLVGFMGAGKSAVGRVLAQALGRRFADTDELVEAAAGCSIEAIFRERGEGRFREIEWEALRGVAEGEGTVVATGGGLFLGTTQRDVIRRHGVSIWLDAPFDVVTLRLRDVACRPLWLGADELDRRAMFERRRAAYALADATVDAGSGDVDAVARRVASRWRALYR